MKPTPQHHTLSQAPEVTQLVHSHLASRSICTLKKSGGQWGIVCICRRGQGKRRTHGSNSWGRLAEQNGSSHVPAPMAVGARLLCRQAQGKALGWAGDACPMAQGGQHIPGAATPGGQTRGRAGC